MYNKYAFSNLTKIPEFHYLCDRNAERVMLEGLGISSPLLLTQSGVFIKKSSFFEDGSLFVDFFRDTFISTASNLINPPSFGLNWNIIRENIKNDCPIIILVDVYYMPYKTHFHKDHAAHCIILNGIKDSSYSVVDWYEPDYYIGFLEEDVLNMARQSTNKEDGSSVFSGYPIKATYKTIDIEKIHAFKYEPAKCAYANLRNMANKLIHKDTKAFFENIKNTIPVWMQKFNEQHYLNAVKSFFFFELELNIFIKYLDEFQKISLEPISDTYCQIKNKTVQLRTAVIILKNKLHRAIRKKDVLDITSWYNFSNVFLSYYNEMLKNIDLGGKP